jgi:hypothetical protein
MEVSSMTTSLRFTSVISTEDMDSEQTVNNSPAKLHQKYEKPAKMDRKSTSTE